MTTTTVHLVKTHTHCPNGDDWCDNDELEVDSFIDAQMVVKELKVAAMMDGFEVFHEAADCVNLGRIANCGAHDCIELYLRIGDKN